MNERLPPVVIYTDGGCRPNPGPGGWGAVILVPGGEPRELSGGKKEATNNRMELIAAIEALGALNGPHRVEIYTDSTYVRQGITEWLPKWRASGWKTAGKKRVKNRDLWEELSTALETHEVEWHWVKGHAGDRWNEVADQLAQLPFHGRRFPSTMARRSTSSPRRPTQARRRPGRGAWFCGLPIPKRG